MTHINLSSAHLNEKYKEFLAKGHTGIEIEDQKALEYIDNKFQQFIKNPEFKYYQIKSKFGYCRFYADGIDEDDIFDFEDNINIILLKEEENDEIEFDEEHKTICEEIHEKGMEMFGKTKFNKFMKNKNPQLGNKKPIDVVKTSEGAKEVLQILGKIEHGVF